MSYAIVQWGKPKLLASIWCSLELGDDGWPIGGTWREVRPGGNARDRRRWRRRRVSA